MSIFSHLKEAPPDAILNTTTAFKACEHPKKVNLGVGAYRTEEGKPYVLPSVITAEERVLAGTKSGRDNKEYVPIDGLPECKPLTRQALFGDALEKSDGERVFSLQALSGTGALSVAGHFITERLPESYHTIYASRPTWGNHKQVFERAGMTVKEYRYYNADTRGLDFEGLVEDLSTMPEKSTVLFHACAHNPTGVDPSDVQWKEILQVIKDRQIYALLDNAYQGYASGDLHHDGRVGRWFLEAGRPFVVCQSFAKNLGMYGERVGMAHFATESEKDAKVVGSLVKLVARSLYSSPPVHGALLVREIFGDADLTAQWKTELRGMADRIKSMRAKVVAGLTKRGTPGSWTHVTDQIGMFSFTGLTPAQCEHLINKWAVYLLKTGRISLAGLNDNNVEYFCDAVDDAVRNA